MEKYRLGRILLTLTTDYRSLCNAVSLRKINRESCENVHKNFHCITNMSNFMKGIRGEMRGGYLNCV